jgi:hypothetical protein
MLLGACGYAYVEYSRKRDAAPRLGSYRPAKAGGS